MDTRSARKEILIFAVTIQSNAKALRSVKLSINETQKSVSWVPAGQKTLKATFAPPLAISISDSLNLELHSSLIGTFSTSEKLIQISGEQLLRSTTDEGDRREWNQTFEKMKVTISLWHEADLNQQYPIASTSFGTGSAQLVPTIEEILRVCPRFRILLIGKTGVGKSSLINKAFGVDDAIVSHFAPGQAEIEMEILSRANPHFVLHDSKGFEPGEATNFNVVRDFIRARHQKSELKDRLHAVWVCMATPTSGSRILETGVEELFRLKNNGKLGNGKAGAEICIDSIACQREKLERLQVRYIRDMMGLHPNSVKAALFTETALWPIQFRRVKAALNYLHYLLLLPPSSFASLALRECISLEESGKGWLFQLDAHLKKLTGITLPTTLSAANVDETIKTLTRYVSESLRRAISVHKSYILAHREILDPYARQSSLQFRTYLLVDNPAHRIALTKMLCGGHPLAVEVYVYRKRAGGLVIPREERLCRLCGLDVEDVPHALFMCKANHRITARRNEFLLGISSTPDPLHVPDPNDDNSLNAWTDFIVGCLASKAHACALAKLAWHVSDVFSTLDVPNFDADPAMGDDIGEAELYAQSEDEDDSDGDDRDGVCFDEEDLVDMNLD